MNKRITPDEYLKESKQGKRCAVVGCLAKPSEKCPGCGAHYCNEHIKTHFHVVEKTKEKHIVTEVEKISKDWFKISYIPIEWAKKYPDSKGWHGAGVTKDICPEIENLRKGDKIIVQVTKGHVTKIRKMKNE